MSRLGRWVPLVAVVALLGAAMLASVYGNPTIEFAPLDPPTFSQETDEPVTATPSTGPSPGPDEPQSAPSLPAWVAWVVSALCLAVILAIAAAMAWVMLRDRLFGSKADAQRRLDAGPTTTDVREGVRAAVDEGLADLDEDGDPRRAVIACWVRLERAGAAAGTARHPGDSSTDFVVRLLSEHQVSADVLEPFADVYRRARYATGDVDTGMRDQARSALVQLRDELVATAGAP